MIQKYTDRFKQLYAEAHEIKATIVEKTSSGYGNYKEMEKEKALTWSVKAKNLIVSACGGEKSLHYKEFIKVEELRSFESKADGFVRSLSVFQAAMDDYQGGYLSSLKNLVQADVFESELEQAEELLKNGYKLAAAVIAGVVLETSLRDMCSNSNIPIGKLDKMNTDLTKAGKYNKLQQKRITSIADIRNNAAHGNDSEFSESDVSNMVRDIEQFLATHLQ